MAIAPAPTTTETVAATKKLLLNCLPQRRPQNGNDDLMPFSPPPRCDGDVLAAARGHRDGGSNDKAITETATKWQRQFNAARCDGDVLAAARGDGDGGSDNKDVAESPAAASTLQTTSAAKWQRRIEGILLAGPGSATLQTMLAANWQQRLKGIRASARRDKDGGSNDKDITESPAMAATLPTTSATRGTAAAADDYDVDDDDVDEDDKPTATTTLKIT